MRVQSLIAALLMLSSPALANDIQTAQWSWSAHERVADIVARWDVQDGGIPSMVNVALDAGGVPVGDIALKNGGTIEASNSCEAVARLIGKMPLEMRADMTGRGAPCAQATASVTASASPTADVVCDLQQGEPIRMRSTRDKVQLASLAPRMRPVADSLPNVCAR